MRQLWLCLIALFLLGTLFLSLRSPRKQQVSSATAKPPSSPSLTATQQASATTPVHAWASSTAVVEPIKLAIPASVQITEPPFSAFNSWAEEYLNAPLSIRPHLESRGLELAQHRRAEMLEMIQFAPQRALELTFPRVQRSLLPLSVQQLLERPINGRGDLYVVAALASQAQNVKPVARTVHLNGEIFQAHVYGRRLDHPSRLDVALQGVALDRHMAVEEFPARIMASDEHTAWRQSPQAPASARCVISGADTGVHADETLLEHDNEIIPVCSREHALKLQQELAAAEGGPADFQAAALAAATGVKSAIIIRCDFSDLPGEPFSLTEGTNLIRNLDKFYRDMSYNRSGWRLLGSGSAITATLRLPQTAAYYGANDASILRSHARSAATAAGFNLGSYQYDLVCFGEVPGFGWAGLGYVGAPGSWIRGGANLGVVAHELGHNFGLNHANFWDTAGLSVIGSGSDVEYGDKFDTMGSASAGSKHFNARYKNYLGWLPTTDVRVVTTGGATNRLFAHDITNATGIRAIRTLKNSVTNYWIEYRANYSGNRWLPEGVGIRWAGINTDNRSSMLLDLTPGSSNGKDDSALAIGRTFSDRVSGVHITPVGKGGTTPASIDVVIHRGLFPGNLPPIALLASSRTSSAVNVPIVFDVTASDPNSDSLAYYWEFGDAAFGANSPSFSKSWSTAGEYLVRCTVSDMKGGQSVISTVVRIGSPTTYRISGRVTDGVAPMEDVVVSAGSKTVSTDSDGRYYITGLSSGSYTLQARKEGYAFSRSGFSNPLILPASRDTADFLAIPSNAETTTSLVTEGALWRYLDNGSNQGTAWRLLSFADNTWKEGAAPLGYGDEEKTGVSFGADAGNKHVTTYFRRKFVVEDRSSILNLTLGVRRDDGAVVYLNNREVYRGNLPAGTISYTTPASDAVGGAEEDTFFETELDPAWLLAGTNILAVELHQASRNSSDIVFDLRLRSVTSGSLPPPVLAVHTSGASIRLQWPETAAQWQIISSSELGNTASWTPVAATIQLLNGQRTAILPIGSDKLFYRLTRTP